MKTFEAQTYTLIDGWINCWTSTDDEGRDCPTYFETAEEAQEDIDDLVEQCQSRGMDINPNDYRVMEVRA